MVSLALRRAGFEVVLVEPGPEGARNAHARGIEYVTCSSLEEAGGRPHALTAALLSAGLSVEFSTYIFAALPLPILLLRTVPSRLGLRSIDSREREAREHRPPRRVLAHLVNGILAGELAAIRRRIPLPFGGSCLAVARVPNSKKG